jgi:hypothetical protein
MELARDACRDGLDRPGGEIVETSQDRFFQAVTMMPD